MRYSFVFLVSLVNMFVNIINLFKCSTDIYTYLKFSVYISMSHPSGAAEIQWLVDGF